MPATAELLIAVIENGVVGTAKTIGCVINGGNTNPPGVPSVGNVAAGAVAAFDTAMAIGEAPKFRKLAKLTWSFVVSLIKTDACEVFVTLSA